MFLLESCWRKLPVFALLALFLPLAHSHELLMNNGDRVSGLLLKVEGDNVVWNSFNFGQLTVHKSKVKNIEVSAKVKMEGRREPCTVSGLDGPFMNYQCADDQAPQRIEFAVVDSIIPFAEHQAGAYTYSGKSTVAINVSRGNEVKDEFDVHATANFRQSDWRHITVLDYESDSNDSEPSIEMYKVSYQLDWFFSERWFWYNKGEIGLDENKDIDFHYSLGTGLGVQVWDFNNMALAIISGIEYAEEQYEETAENLADPDWQDSKTENFWSLAYDFRYRLPYSIQLFSKAEFLYSTDNSQDWVLDSEIGFDVPIVGRLVSEYKFEYDYDNLPNGDNRKEDKKLTIGIGYQW
ncbi:MAG: hypothetical protein AseanaTS_26300 [Candidatus Pelagadaptatus aseana]|uniref:DUF481 domain-containing protein n=1 Tax=Candidatus Pelagadaptatus aseana TaxID=3120508 RepID=UPI0039B20C5E